MAIEVVTTPGAIQTLPSAGAGASITPSGTAWANSAYAQISAAVGSDLILLGVTVAIALGADYEVDIATGGAGSETVIATVTGCDQFAVMSNGYHPLSIPIDNIPNGARLAARLRKTGSSTTAVLVSVQVLAKPASGVSVTTNPSKVFPSAANSATVSTGSNNFTPTAYTQVVAATADAIVLAGVCVCVSNSFGELSQTEIDIAIGAAGSETVVTTVRTDATTGASAYFALRPLLDNIPSGSRIAVRARSNNSIGNASIRLVYYNKTGLGVVTNLLTTKPLKWFPPAAANIQVVPANGSWGSGTPAQFSASLPNNSQVVAMAIGAGSGGEKEYDLMIGGAGAEVSQSTSRVRYVDNTSNGYTSPHLPFPIDKFPAGSRLSVRVRQNGGGVGSSIALGYYENCDAGLLSTLGLFSLPAAADGISLTPNGSAWANSTWVELTAASGTNVGVVSLHVIEGVTSVEYELDLGTGAAGSETVVATHRGYSTTNNGVKELMFYVPYQIQVSSRLAVRLRKAGTSTTAWTVGATLATLATIAPTGGLRRNAALDGLSASGTFFDNPAAA